MKKKIAIQGISGSYHHEAASELVQGDYELVECGSFRDLASALRRKEVHYAVMAIENSIAGSILPNYTLMSKNNFTIIAEKYHYIHHHLLCHKNSSIQDIKEIHSHPMALLQCEDFFEANPHFSIVETADTAWSAKEIYTRGWKDVAAIAPKKSAEIYDLRIIHDEIQTFKKNYTRFFLLTNYQNKQIENFDKISIRFSLLNYSGNLAHVLTDFSDAGINLTKIQSVPIVERPGSYSFYMDFIIESLAQYDVFSTKIAPTLTDFEILGKYKNAQPLWMRLQD